jgi:hypothetical protein
LIQVNALASKKPSLLAVANSAARSRLLLLRKHPALPTFPTAVN